ncbi:Uncharacterised protein [Aerococcus viridans]|nr:Uncharacterised protein [Aerococcus viridans]
MKKRKTYEISVIDKTYSKIISDETKFYTSDTALELVFKLKETEYNFESAEIVLLNIDDRSLVTRPVTKIKDSFTYELDDDIIAHFGDWRGQLRFEQAGEIYVSSPVKFRIENDLSNERPPQLSDVQSWVSLKRYADGLVDELKQAVEEAVANVEAMDDTFKANELERDKAERERQARFEDAESEREKGESVRVETFQTNEANRQDKFETTEQSRQTTFETNESERDETFNTNEDIRQQQELEREKAEATRQTVFDGNEANRTETFNTNEATRQENETARQQAEQERQSAELIRVEAEMLRVERDANRETEISDIKKDVERFNTVKLNNLIDYSNVSSSDYDLNINGVEIIAKVKNLSSIGTINFSTPVKIAPPNKYYARLDIEVLYKNYSAIVFGGYIATAVTNNLVAGKEAAISAVSQPTSPLSVAVVRFTHQTNTGGYKVGDEIRLKNMMVVDLTKSFGAGNEPSKEVMDWIIKNNGYFDELTIRRDDIQQYEINQIRKAVIALGGNL